MSRDSVQNLTKDLKDILIKIKQELRNKDAYIKKQNTINDLTKKEYQKLYEDYNKLKKKNEYESYARTQRIEKRRKEQNDNEKQKKAQELRSVNDLALLNEI